jgi:hypothetical protein
MRHFVGKELFYIFPEAQGEPRYFKPNWAEAKERATEVLRELTKLEPAEFDEFCPGLSQSIDQHLNQIEVMVETIDFVLNSDNPKEFLILWSG